MPVQALARRLKHAFWLSRRAIRRRLHASFAAVRDAILHVGDRVLPPRYHDGDFPDSFIDRVPKAMDAPGIDGVPRRIFALWTGDNPLTPNRVQALEELRSANSGCQVHLVTPGELETWIVPGAPLPRGFWHLSCIHRADYLRAYLMHHHGGCYVDIKRGYGDLTRSFDLLDSQPSKWVSGYRELGADHVSDEPGKIGRAMRRHHGLLVGTSAFIARPSTALTTEWLAEVDRRLDDYADALESAPGDAFGQNVGYPVPWGAILGAVFQPLCLKYVERVLVDDGIRPSFENYR